MHLEQILSGHRTDLVALIVAAGLCIFVFSLTVVHLLPRGLRIDSFSAAGATLALDKGEHSYFNKYRDELIYLFEANRFDIVIFEDIDRFDDLSIFVELRNLNFILNHAPGVISCVRGHRVKFIFAVKDSLFVPGDESDSSVVKGSGRTKLFDQIISVVPFASKMNAFDLALSVFENDISEMDYTEEKDRFEELLRLAAPYIADMRLLYSVHNDYLIMVQEMGPITSGGASPLGLTFTGVLAIAIVKNVRPDEYEKMRLGNSVFDELYRIHSDAVQARLSSLRPAQAACHSLLNETNDEMSRFLYLGKKLIESLNKRTGNLGSIVINGKEFSVNGSSGDAIYEVAFWRRLFSLAPSEDISLKWRSYNDVFNLSKDSFIDMFIPGLPYAGIRGNDIDKLTKMDETGLSKEIERLQGADFDTDWSLPSRNGKDPEETEFKNCAWSVLGDDLLFELVYNGFIRKDFNLYVAKYPSDARARAIDFITHCYERNVQNVDMFLDENDCREVLKAVPKAALKRKSCLNYCLFDYLLAKQDSEERVRNMVEAAIDDFDLAGRAVFDRVMAVDGPDGLKARKLIEIVTPMFGGAIDYFIGYAASRQSKEDALLLAKTCLLSIDSEQECGVSHCAEWLMNHFEEIDFSGCDKGDGWAEALARLLEKAGVEIDYLKKYAGPIKAALIKRGLFVVKRSNLLAANENDSIPSLDDSSMRAETKRKVLESYDTFKGYLDSLTGDECSLSNVNDESLEPIFGAVKEWSCSGQQKADAVLSLFIKASNKQPIFDIYALIRIAGPDGSGLSEAIASDAFEEMISNILNELQVKGMIEHSLLNVLTLAKYAQKDKFCARERFNYFVVNEKAIDRINFDGIDTSDVRVLSEALLGTSGADNQIVLDAMSAMKLACTAAFPLMVNNSWRVYLNRGGAFYADLFESGLIGNAEEVYTLLNGEHWAVRERVLRAWSNDGATYRWDYRFPLMAGDLIHILRSKRLEGTWIKSNVKDYWDDYIARSGASENESQKARRDVEKYLEGKKRKN